MARLSFFDSGRLTLKILQHKDLEWLQTIKDDNNGRELHCRYIKVWRWETVLFNYMRENHPDDKWLFLAQDKERWREMTEQIM